MIFLEAKNAEIFPINRKVRVGLPEKILVRTFLMRHFYKNGKVRVKRNSEEGDFLEKENKSERKKIPEQKERYENVIKKGIGVAKRLLEAKSERRVTIREKRVL